MVPDFVMDPLLDEAIVGPVADVLARTGLKGILNEDGGAADAGTGAALAAATADRSDLARTRLVAP